MNKPENWYEIEDIDQIDSPALVFYPDNVQHNIELLKQMVGDISRLRPHIKTSKSAGVIKLLLNAGITKFKCATIAEAELLAIQGAPDILLAYQPTTVKLRRLFALMDHYNQSHFSCLLDNLDSAGLFSQMAHAADKILTVYIDLNVGMDRTGIAANANGENILALYKFIVAKPALDLAGFHAYDGHVRAIDFQERIKECNGYFELFEQIRNQIEAAGFEYPLLIGGGSPSCMIHFQRKHTELSPGTFVFWDRGYRVNLPEQPFDFGAVVITRVISLPSEEKICIDLGYKSIASENDINHRVYFLNAPQLMPFSHSEEHMVINAGKGHGYKIGDVLYALPYHICPTVALYESGYCVEQRKVTGKWAIDARKRTVNF